MFRSLTSAEIAQLEVREYFHADAYVNWHCSNEHFTVEEFIRANCEYPGNRGGEVEKIVTTDDMIICLTYISDHHLSQLPFHTPLPLPYHG